MSRAPQPDPSAAAAPGGLPAHAADGVPASASTPYAELTPAAVLDALDAVGLPGDGRLLQLNSYENRVFQVHLEDGRVVVAKFYRPGRWSDAQILEEHAFARELAAAEVPVVAPLVLQPPPGSAAQLAGDPPTLAHHRGMRLAVAPRRGGRAPELDDPAVLQWIGRFIGRLHTVGAARPFAHRTAIDVAGMGRAARDWLLAGDLIPPDVAPAWQAAADAALALSQQAFDAVPQLRRIRLHGDCHAGNVLWTPDAGPHFVDLDDAATGPAIQDLWMLLPGEDEPARRQLDALLRGYREMADFDERERRLIEPLRTLRLIHHSAWLARRWADPAFPAAFPWFGGSGYWAQQAQQLREQVQALQRSVDAPAAAGMGGADDEDFEFDKGFR
jgi:Ser/Thr protein kinase RdoA (MazF antagonist)